MNNRNHPWRWALAILAGIFIAAGIWLIVLAWNWPFTQPAVAKALTDRYARPVDIRSFRSTYFPPGCVLEGISFQHRKRKNLPPLITVATLTIRASYSGLLPFRKRIDKVEIRGLHIQIPPKDQNGKEPNVFPLTNSVSGATLTIGEIEADGALLEFSPQEPGKEPFRLKIGQLKLDNVGESGPVAFHTVFQNTEPPGEIRSDGQVGPWNENDPGSTPVSGSYSYKNVDLGFFQGLNGTLLAHGKMSGVIREIHSGGDVDVPDFRVGGSSAAVHVTAKFEAVVNGTNGDTELQKVQSNFQKTTLLTKGTIAGQPGEHGKAATLEMAAQRARIEDLLRLFAGVAQPSLRGPIELRAKVRFPPGPETFLKRLSIDGDFGIAGQQFTDAGIQTKVDKLGESAQGESKKQQAEDSEIVLSNLKGHVALKNGIATLSNISFTEPGTSAEMAGNFNLLDKSLHFAGVLRTTGKLSDTTSGFKAVVLKGLAPFLKKKTLTVVAFTISGTSSQPSFALDLAGKRKF